MMLALEWAPVSELSTRDHGSTNGGPRSAVIADVAGVKALAPDGPNG